RPASTARRRAAAAGFRASLPAVGCNQTVGFASHSGNAKSVGVAVAKGGERDVVLARPPGPLRRRPSREDLLEALTGEVLGGDLEGREQRRGEVWLEGRQGDLPLGGCVDYVYRYTAAEQLPRRGQPVRVRTGLC